MVAPFPRLQRRGPGGGPDFSRRASGKRWPAHRRPSESGWPWTVQRCVRADGKSRAEPGDATRCRCRLPSTSSAAHGCCKVACSVVSGEAGRPAGLPGGLRAAASPALPTRVRPAGGWGGAKPSLRPTSMRPARAHASSWPATC